MKIAICYESVVPARGGCETYIADLVRRLVADRHEVHLYAQERDAKALPSQVVFHALMPIDGPRFLRPWRFAAACEHAVDREGHDVVVGFVKTWRQDVILPQGGLHVASADYNIRKHRTPGQRFVAQLGKWLSPSFWSYRWLERRQYAGRHQPLIIASSRMVRDHFQEYYGIGAERVRVIPNAIDPHRFAERDRLKLRSELRRKLGLTPEEPVGLFVGHNYRLKGLDTLLEALHARPDLPAKMLICGSARIGRYVRLGERLRVMDRIRLLGFCKDVRQAFFAADFLVHPTFYDPCSLVVLEALACGLPVITTNCNGAAELLHPPDDGLVLTDPHDAATLGGYIEQFCEPARRAAASQQARLTAAAWTFEDHYLAVLGALEEAARRKLAA
jgi:UDP-glucose:(heptosyl)LPS alpha-1,3-glucosyltransferase